uniref:Translocation protein SEC62 n=1 Tax=Corethrella appendiculata TaxID=1370023 RepID=U5EZQ0_9DIPT
MADKKRSKKRKDEYTGPGGADQEQEKISKDEYKVAKWLKSHVPTKKTKFLNHNVEYFSAIKALDALMSSKFAQGDNCLFPHRQAAIDFMDDMLNHRFFHRAKKVPVTEQELRGKSKKLKNDDAKEKEKESSVSTKKDTDAESSHAEGGAGGKVETKPNDEKEKRKRKIRLEMHLEQIFVDGHEAYVWIYDPIPMHYWIFGALLVIGAIVICLFPLWPPLLRKGVYYLSLAAAGFLVAILGLAVIRFIVFCIVWIVTGGKHHFWIFPNLTEDVGFIQSFWPLYKHEYKDGKETQKKNKKRKRDKDSDAEDESAQLLETAKIDEIKEHDAELSDEHSSNSQNARSRSKRKIVNTENDDDGEENVKDGDNAKDGGDSDDNGEQKASITPSESESESSSQRSSTGKDFEMVDSADVDTS